jgi:hypothetical protein
MRRDMQHLCGMPMTKTKLLSKMALGRLIQPKQSSSSSAEWYREQRELDNYGSSMPTKPSHYMSDEDTSSDSGNGFENLARN